MKKELTFTAFHRVGYLRQAVASWNKNKYSLGEWPASYLLEPSDAITENAMIKEFDQLESKRLLGVINDHRLGVLKNPHAALTQAFDAGNEFVVLAEDDIVVSDDTLEYFEWAMEKYKEDKSVLAVLAFSRVPVTWPRLYSGAVARTKVFCPLVWGTWVDRWEDTIRPNWDLDYSTGTADQGAGWDWNMMRVAVAKNQDFIYPMASRSCHIGRFGGVHTNEFSFPESQAATFRDFHVRDGHFVEVDIEDWKLNDYYPRTD